MRLNCHPASAAPRARHLALLAALLSGPTMLATMAAVPAAAAEAKGPTVRPEIGKPLQAARAAATKKRYKDALVQIAKAEAIGQRTDHEQYVIDEMKAYVYVGMRQPGKAADALEAALKSGRLGGADQAKRLHALANLHYQAGNFGDAISFANRAQKAGASAGDLRQLVAQSYYQKGDLVAAGREYERMAADAERAGKAPTEDLLKTLVGIAYRQNDQAAYAAALQRMVTHHPSPAYWRDLLITVRNRPGFSDKLAIDVERLMLATGALKEPREYMEFAQQLLLANLPGEAEAALRKGVESKVLGGGGADASRQQRLIDMAARQAAQQRSTLDHTASEARRAGQPAKLAEVGLAYASFGDPVTGGGLLSEALARATDDGAKSHLRLRLGMVQMAGGQTQDAKATLQQVSGTDGAAVLAKLWQIQGAEEA